MSLDDFDELEEETFDGWKEKGKLFNLGHVIFGVYQDNIPKEAQPLGEVMNLTVTRTKLEIPPKDDEKIEEAIKEKYPLANSYSIISIKGVMHSNKYPQKTEYKIQAHKTDEAWLRKKYDEAVKRRESSDR